MKRVVFNQKGGVGKSTIVCNLAAINAAQGRSTVVIDLDVQGNSSQYLLGDEWQQKDTNIGKYFEHILRHPRRKADPAEFCVESPFDELWVMPAADNLPDLQNQLEAKHKIYKLRDTLNKLAEEVDDIYIDTPPAFNFFTFSALIAAERVLIPFDCDEFSRKALYQLLENVEETQEDHNDELEVEGIIVNQFQARSNLPQRMVDELIEDGLPVFEEMISGSVVVKESHEASCPLIHYNRSHKVTQQFISLYESLAD